MIEHPNGEGVVSQKIAFDISLEDNKRLNDMIPWGLKSTVFRRMTEMLLAMLDGMGTSRGKVLAAIIDGDLVLMPRVQVEEWKRVYKELYQSGVQDGS
jgi:hypothetical protein